MDILGINAVFHDSSACLVRDGEVVAAAEEERFNRIKHGKRPVPFSTWELPFGAIDYCLREGGITMAQVDHVAYSFDPIAETGGGRLPNRFELPLEPSAGAADGEAPWENLFLSYVVNAPRQLASAAPHHLKARFEGIDQDGPFSWHYVEHHLAHAASAFFPSPFERAAVLTVDGRGERATTTYSIGAGDSIEEVGRVEMPNSIGLLYEEVTEHLGFLRSSDEYKVMALASYAQPTLADGLRSLIEIDGGDYRIDMDGLPALLGDRRRRGEIFDDRHFEIAASLQQVTEEVMLSLARWLHEQTGERDLCMAGGVALNCVMNSRVLSHGPFDRVWVQPAAGDAGTAMGAALWVAAHQSGRSAYRMHDAFLGPGYGDDDIEEFLRWSKLPYERLDDVIGETARLLARDRIVGWFQGRMEFGPRALGARSILASPLRESMRERLNDIKDREDFRPVAPVVLADRADEFFDHGPDPSPFMLFVHDVRPDTAERIPAVRHVDGTARVQTIDRTQHAAYYDLVKAFGDITGVPVLVNTSFNTRGEPIVCTPRDAIECFWTSPLDDLVIGSFVLHKEAAGAGRSTDLFGLGSPGESVPPSDDGRAA